MTPNAPRLLIVGCGDVGTRVLARLPPRWHALATTSSAANRQLLQQAGATPLLVDLDQPASLGRLAGLADAVIMLVPPPRAGLVDTRSRHLAQALARRTPPARLVYVGTSGVYGDCDGALVDETRALQPATPRARRRADAEAVWRAFGRRCGTRVSLLRVPGIYAPDRPGGDPRERVRSGHPALQRDQDVYTNHVHADDLARTCLAALWRGGPGRVYNVNDDAHWLSGDYLDAVARHQGLPLVGRMSREQAGRSLSPMQLSFLGESRRLLNRRLKRELGLRLCYPTVLDALDALDDAGSGKAVPV